MVAWRPEGWEADPVTTDVQGPRTLCLYNGSGKVSLSLFPTPLTPKLRTKRQLCFYVAGNFSTGVLIRPFHSPAVTINAPILEMGKLSPCDEKGLGSGNTAGGGDAGFFQRKV